MDNKLISKSVSYSYEVENNNCAVTSLQILSNLFSVPVHDQVYDAAVGMHGGGGYRGQCGLVEGPLLFIGIAGKSLGLSHDAIVQACYNFADVFTQKFGSLTCRELRPGGFRADDPPHLCMDLSKRTVEFNYLFIKQQLFDTQTLERSDDKPDEKG